MGASVLASLSRQRDLRIIEPEKLDTVAVDESSQDVEYIQALCPGGNYLPGE